jgi:tetratricopeptide (TPR) repeat protein
MNDSTTTEFAEKPRPARFRRLLLWVVCIGVALTGILLALSKSYGWAKRFQAARLAQMAGGYAEQGKMQEAVMSADTALRLDPRQPTALRFMAELFEADGRSNQAMELYGRLYQSGSGSLEDLKKQALNALRAGYTEPATYLAQLVAEKGEPDFPLLLEAEIKAHNGENAEALDLLRQAVSLHGGRSSRLALLQLLLKTPNADNRNIEISEQLMNLKDGTDLASLEALAVGVSSDLLPPETRLEWIKKIRQHPIKRLPLLLFADTTEVQLDPASQPRVAAELVQRVRGRSLQDRLQAAQWLLWKGQPRDAVEILPLKDALTRADAMRTWVDLAAAIGEWNTLRDALAVPTNQVLWRDVGLLQECQRGEFFSLLKSGEGKCEAHGGVGGVFLEAFFERGGIRHAAEYQVEVGGIVKDEIVVFEGFAILRHLKKLAEPRGVARLCHHGNETLHRRHGVPRLGELVGQ